MNRRALTRQVCQLSLGKVKMSICFFFIPTVIRSAREESHKCCSMSNKPPFPPSPLPASPNPLFPSSFLPDCSLPFSVYVLLLSQNSSCCPCLNPPPSSISLSSPTPSSPPPFPFLPASFLSPALPLRRPSFSFGSNFL